MNGNVREIAWRPWFDLVFRPAMSAIENKARSSDADDGKIIAALDNQYQAAVKGNDAGTMGRILTDDFVLVTGSGKTYSRADLLRKHAAGACSL